MLMHLVDVPQARKLGLAGYRDELEAALVPLNRAAARRVLARQLRELTRPRAGTRPGDGAGTGPEDAVAADADLDALLGYEAPPADSEPEAPAAPSEPPAPAPPAVMPERMREPTASAALAGPGPAPAPLGYHEPPHLSRVRHPRRRRPRPHRRRGPRHRAARSAPSTPSVGSSASVGRDCRELVRGCIRELLVGPARDGPAGHVKIEVGPTPCCTSPCTTSTLDGGVMVTGSHNPPETTASRSCGQGVALRRDIVALRERIARRDFELPSAARRASRGGRAYVAS
jgi:hypothetical protein